MDNTTVIASLPHTPCILKSFSLTTTNWIRFFNQPDTRRAKGRGKEKKEKEYGIPSSIQYATLQCVLAHGYPPARQWVVKEMETHRLRTCRVKMKRPVSLSLQARGASYGQRDTQEESSRVAVPLMSLTFFATSKPWRSFFRVHLAIMRSYRVSTTSIDDPIVTCFHWPPRNIQEKMCRNEIG